MQVGAGMFPLLWGRRGRPVCATVAMIIYVVVFVALISGLLFIVTAIAGCCANQHSNMDDDDEVPTTFEVVFSGDPTESKWVWRGESKKRYDTEVWYFQDFPPWTDDDRALYRSHNNWSGRRWSNEAAIAVSSDREWRRYSHLTFDQHEDGTRTCYRYTLKDDSQEYEKKLVKFQKDVFVFVIQNHGEHESLDYIKSPNDIKYDADKNIYIINTGGGDTYLSHKIPKMQKKRVWLFDGKIIR